MNPFVVDARFPRVVFGVGSVEQVPAEVERLGCQRALLLSTAGQRARGEALAHLLGDRAAGVFDGAKMHVPVEVAETARAAARAASADCAVAVGGGSAIGLAKALAQDSGIPILAVPTTYSGSEMTSVFGLTRQGQKQTGKDPRVLPRTVIYDAALTRELPVATSVVSAFNAIAHAAEGLYGRDGNPLHHLLAEEGVRVFVKALPALVADPAALGPREECLYAAWMCGAVLGAVGMALHHKLCHALGGTFGLPHAETHTVVLPYALAYNRLAAPAAFERLGRALDASDVPGALYELRRRLQAPGSLRELGMPREGLDRAAELATTEPYWNPRPIERTALRELLEDAWEGGRPREV
jgi:maleylacetate reductase